MLESEEIDTSNNSDINDTCKNLYLSEKEREERREVSKYTIGKRIKWLGLVQERPIMAITVSIKENAFKKTFDKSFALTLNFDIFKHPVYLKDLKKI